MTTCSRLEKCPFYRNQLIIDMGVGDFLKKEFCLSGNHVNCARLLVASTVGSEYVDDTLFPNNIEKANQIIAKVKQGKK
ncbi:MAG: hypothetical protein SPI86_09800 [Treponemataceae bacterium]|nr:hypothetical protein [Spirochaetales bacterium]MDY6032035.1 hypothetical protein [Treponemataceae bacterium]